MKHLHHYKLTTKWNGNKGTGTSHVSEYDRSHTVTIDGKPAIQLTTDNAMYGDRSKLNPEDLLVAALSSCHMLSYLYLCSEAGVVITDYVDNATGIMEESITGGGHFTEVTLNPVCIVKDESMVELAVALHHKAGEICYIASSVNFKVGHKPTCKVAEHA